MKYVHKLSNQHLSSSNFIEAGLTILLHADLLNWSDETVDELPEVGYPSELQRERKERLYKLSVDYLDKGKAWEKAIQLLEQLRKLYEFTVYDYPKLADVLVCSQFLLLFVIINATTANGEHLLPQDCWSRALLC